MEAAREQSSASSSGCESGWTTYLDQSEDRLCSRVEKNCCWGAVVDHGCVAREEEDDEEENLSMVSDASSGPPSHFQEENGALCFCSLSLPPSKRRRIEPARHHRQQGGDGDALDDTASSHLSSFSQRDASGSGGKEPYLESSCSFSATHLKKRSDVESCMSYFRPKSPELLWKGEGEMERMQ